MVALASSEPISRHKCLIYDGQPSEQLPVVIPLLTEGLREKWRCLYLGDPATVQLVDSALESSGVDTRREIERGALVLSSDRSHLKDGKFDPLTMVEGLSASIDGAVHDGFKGLCATGDMKWELGDDGNFDRLLEYEARLEQVFHQKPLTGICQYHRSLVPAFAVRDALLTHRSAFVGGSLNPDNLFYIPPELLLEARGGLDSARYGDWMCQQILRVLAAERARDEVLQSLRESESRQRRLAEELAETNRVLDQRVAERTVELEVANRHLESFSYSVSHDLRAPLRAIQGFARMLEEDFGKQLAPEGQQHLRRVLAGTLRMNELIDGLLELGRSTKTALELQPVDLGALASEVFQQARASTPARKVEIAIAKDLRAHGDPTLLRTALTNLIENAWKFTSRLENARIEVGRLGDENGKAIFFVRDNGAGFDMRYAQKLFGVFQRLHTQEQFPGHGVGLATTERIISKHGGRLWAESRPNEGATFFFTLPTPAGPPAAAA